MDIALLVGLCILLTMCIVGLFFAYSYNTYTRDRLFTKMKFPLLGVILLSIVIVCLIILITLIGLNFNSKPNKYMLAYIVLCGCILSFAIGYLLFFIVIYKLNNKNKIDYLDIPNIDWKKKEQELLAKVSDMEAVKSKLSAKNTKYYTSMLEYYKNIVFRAGQKNLPISETIADIVTFNDAFTHKWCGKMNVYQLQLTYKFCMLFQKNPGQK